MSVTQQPTTTPAHHASFARHVQARFAEMFRTHGLVENDHFSLAEHQVSHGVCTTLLGDDIHEHVALNLTINAQQRTVNVALIDKVHRRPPLMLRSTPIGLRLDRQDAVKMTAHGEQTVQALLDDTSRRLQTLLSDAQALTWDTLSAHFPTKDMQE